MNFFVEYFKLIDLLALAALAALACAAFVRSRSVWLFLAGILVAIWGAMQTDLHHRARSSLPHRPQGLIRRI